MDTPSGTRDDAPSSTPTSKRPTASLLPAFEPFSSSPALPRPLKRTRDTFEETRLYPTPLPTSSTAILSSSPPLNTSVRPPPHRSLSTLSDRAPLGVVPSITLNSDGQPIRLGRSSASCDYQFASNRLISRVHVEATYKPAASRLGRDRVEIKCSGWNGIRVHCQSQVYEVKKGETFTSDIRDEEIMLDVHDSRVTLQWPEKPHLGPASSDEEEEGSGTSPTKKQRAMRRHSTPPSPSPMQTRKRAPSPVSPSPAIQVSLPSSPPLLPTDGASHVQIYEDPLPPPSEQPDVGSTQPSQQATQLLSESFTGLSQIKPDTPNLSHEYSDNDEENDPIIHSFGPFGANLLPRLAAFSAADSPRQSNSTNASRPSNAEPLQSLQSPPQRVNKPSKFDVRSHVINQLAFSRLSSTPLSTILSHLPPDAEVSNTDDLKSLIDETRCIGEVTREGKDAAGKRLESEFYYIPDEDDDEGRKEAIVHDLRKPGLRACRKQHKQYFWRKPK